MATIITHGETGVPRRNSGHSACGMRLLGTDRQLQTAMKCSYVPCVPAYSAMKQRLKFQRTPLFTACLPRHQTLDLDILMKTLGRPRAAKAHRLPEPSRRRHALHELLDGLLLRLDLRPPLRLPHLPPLFPHLVPLLVELTQLLERSGDRRTNRIENYMLQRNVDL